MAEPAHSNPAPDAADLPELSRRERKKLELRARVLDAARSLFDERGFAATRISEICERADIAEKTFFNHFPSKQHVVRSLAIAASERLVADIEAIRKQPGSTRDHLLDFFAQVAENGATTSPLHRELLTEIIHALHAERGEASGAADESDDGDAGNDDDESLTVRRLHDAFHELVLDGVAAGEITPGYDPEAMTETILGSFYSMMFNWAHRDDYPIRERVAETARFLVDAIAPASAATREHRSTEPDAVRVKEQTS